MERRMDRREREREKSRQSSSQSDRVDLDSRTPLAWQHRDFNYHGQTSAFHERYPEGGVASSGSDRFSHPSIGSRSARSTAAAMAVAAAAAAQRQRQHSDGEQFSHKMASSSRSSSNTKKLSTSSQETGNRNSAHQSRCSEETTGASSSETETDAERRQPSRPGTSGTLGSIQSMPLLNPLQAAFNPSLGGIYGVVGMGPPPLPPTVNPTWNGEPCPVHGTGMGPQMAMYATPNVAYSSIYSSLPVARAPSMHELAMATPLPAIMPPPGPIYGTLPAPPSAGPFLVAAPPPPRQPEPALVMMAGPPSLIGPPPPSSLGGRKIRQPRSGPGSLPPMPPSSLLPPMQVRGQGMHRPIVVNGKNGQAEPLPIRDAAPLPPKIPPSDVASRTNSKSSSTKMFSYNSCCKGNVVVLWIILGIIGLGVVMAVVFYYAFQ